MKFCSKCGTQLVDDAIVCTGCGCAVATVPAAPVATAEIMAEAPSKNVSGITTAAKVLMVLGTIMTGIYIIPLAWCIPMTVSYFNRIRDGRPISTGFKVCSLLFVSMIGGILMLCDKEH